ncbi:MAG: BamA/TamA family outer membrane protein [Candidatus Longimicrobiales bacterium M2_2A_002]
MGTRWRGIESVWAAVLVALAVLPGGLPGQDSTATGDTVPPADERPATGYGVYPLPVIFYTPETRVAGGAAALITHRSSEADRPTLASVTGIYTQNEQVITELALEGYPGGGDYHYAGYGAYQRYPDVAYALGNDSNPDDTEDYTRVGFELALDLDRRVAPGVYVGGGLRIADDDLVDLEGGGPLSDGRLPGADGGTVWGTALRVIRDTRDEVISPATGVLASVSVRGHPDGLGSDYGFLRYTLDGRRYLRAGPGVVALRTTMSGVSGDAPFRFLPTLGGQNLLRGYFDGRFRDRFLAAVQAEYRLRVWWRLGVAFFAAAGHVARDPRGMRLDGFHPSGGLGLRFLLDPDQGVNIRIDYGVGEGGASGVYITATEAF